MTKFNAPLTQASATLALVIRAERASAATWLQGTADEVNEAIAHARMNCTERIAREYARTAAIDRVVFLRACGIED